MTGREAAAGTIGLGRTGHLQNGRLPGGSIGVGPLRLGSLQAARHPRPRTALRNWLAWMPCFHCGSHLDFRGRRAPASPPQSPPKANSKTASPNPRVVRYPKAAVSFMESAWATWTWSREQTHTYGPDFSARSLFPPDARVSWWLQSKHQFFVAQTKTEVRMLLTPFRVPGMRQSVPVAMNGETGI